MKRYLLFIAFCGLLISCTDNHNNFFLKTGSAEGLSTETKLTAHGYEIGEVENVSLMKNGEILIEVKQSGKNQIPADSRFTLTNLDIFGEKGIEVSLGKEQTVVTIHDTFWLNDEPKPGLLDSLYNSITAVITGLDYTQKNDSILIELRRLNANLESLDRVKH